jgi:hypothetical protein
MEITNQHVEAVIRDYVERYLAGNSAARIIAGSLDTIGIGLRPVLDHISIRTHDIQERAGEFEALGFAYDDRIGVIQRDEWWAKVYRKPGFPAIYLDQAFIDARGERSPIPKWVERFSDGQLHHLAIAVDTIEGAIAGFGALGVKFTGEIIGDPGSEFRQIYTEPEQVDGEAFTALELVERRWGYTGFLSPVTPEAAL